MKIKKTIIGFSLLVFASTTLQAYDCTQAPTSNPDEQRFLTNCIFPNMGVGGLDTIKDFNYNEESNQMTIYYTDPTKSPTTYILPPKGNQGVQGRGVNSITKTSVEGLVDTYTINYSDESKSTFTVTNGKDGQSIVGETGETGARGVAGVTPTIGEDGNWYVGGVNTNISVKGDKGEVGATGVAGSTPTIGENGNWFIDGEDTGFSSTGTTEGSGSATVSFNSEQYLAELGEYRDELAEYQARTDDLAQYTASAAAGAVALSTIDFGASYEGSLEVGVGFGVSGTRNYGSSHLTGYAGAAGMKYGINDKDSVIVKAWVGDHKSYGMGGGLTRRF